MISEERTPSVVEDYAKALYSLETRAQGAPVRTSALADRLGLSAPQVSLMCKRLAEMGLVNRSAYHGVQLTDDGRRIALQVLRHHRLLELFLADQLGMTWDRVHAEAEILEHWVSDELEAAIAEKLGHPTVDPHGDPIPTVDLVIDEGQTVSLDSLGVGDAGVFVRVSDSDPGMLRFLSEKGVVPGERLEVVEKQPFDGPVFLRRADDADDLVLGVQLARAMRIELDETGARPGGRARHEGALPPPARRPPGRRRASCRAARRPSSSGRRRRAGGHGRWRDRRVCRVCRICGGVRGPSALELLLARGRVRGALAMLGPAFVAAIAYVDPGNFATNIQGGARFGYLLLWVVLAANLIAMLIQYLSAKVGIVTDRTLPELFREQFPRSLSIGMWVQAEIIAMSTDIAEFVGAALGLNLLFGVPLVWAGGMTAVIAFAILELQTHGYRRFELAISGLLGIIFLGFLYETLKIGPSAHASLAGLVPHLSGTDSLYVAVGILGATVMPHAIYLHSALTKNRVPVRDSSERGRVLRYQKLDIVIALGAAGLVNLAMLAVAAKLFHGSGHAAVTTIEQAYHGFGSQVGGVAALAFVVALLASGTSSSSVGTYAGQVVMQGFVGVRVPLMIRRAVTMVPALVVLAIGVNPTSALILSQVVLSFGIPFALIPLVMLTRRADLMGAHVNRLATTVLAGGLAAAITVMNGFLIYQQLAG